MYVMTSGATLCCSRMPRNRPRAVSNSSGARVVLAGDSHALRARLYVTVSGCTPEAHGHVPSEEELQHEKAGGDV